MPARTDSVLRSRVVEVRCTLMFYFMEPDGAARTVILAILLTLILRHMSSGAP